MKNSVFFIQIFDLDFRHKIMFKILVKMQIEYIKNKYNISYNKVKRILADYIMKMEAYYGI